MRVIILVLRGKITGKNHFPIPDFYESLRIRRVENQKSGFHRKYKKTIKPFENNAGLN